MSLLFTLAWLLCLTFLLERSFKWLLVWAFFRRPSPPAPTPWPQVALLQPITHSPNDLAAVLRARARLDYPGQVQQILVFDAADLASQAIFTRVQSEFPGWQPRVVLAQAAEEAPQASKLVKLALALAQVETQAGLLCFVDDDILLPPQALQTLAAHLAQPGVGAVFGLARYTNWSNPWSGLMSAFVNSNALLTYIPFTFFLDPFTITGHCYAFTRPVFEAAGGLADMAERLDDDHELARRVSRLGLRLCQTPLIYGVDNRFADRRGYQIQMKRWFVFPRQHLLPHLSIGQQFAFLFGTLGNLLPGLLALLALLETAGRLLLAWPAAPTWLGGAAGAFGAALLLSGLSSLLSEWFYRRYAAPPANLPPPSWAGWLLLSLAAALFSPFQALWGLLSDDQIEWRGQRLRVLRGGGYKRL